MAQQFKVGDVVRLKSGGVRMTVELIDGDAVLCVWFDKNDLKRGGFPSETLEAVADRPPMAMASRGGGPDSWMGR